MYMMFSLWNSMFSSTSNIPKRYGGQVWWSVMVIYKQDIWVVFMSSPNIFIPCHTSQKAVTLFSMICTLLLSSSAVQYSQTQWQRLCILVSCWNGLAHYLLFAYALLVSRLLSVLPDSAVCLHFFVWVQRLKMFADVKIAGLCLSPPSLLCNDTPEGQLAL